MHNPIGIDPSTNVTPTRTTTKTGDRWRMDTKDYAARMQLYMPVIAQFFLRHLAHSEKSQLEKVKVSAAFFTSSYVNLVFRAMANLG